MYIDIDMQIRFFQLVYLYLSVETVSIDKAKKPLLLALRICRQLWRCQEVKCG